MFLKVQFCKICHNSKDFDATARYPLFHRGSFKHSTLTNCGNMYTTNLEV